MRNGQGDRDRPAGPLVRIAAGDCLQGPGWRAGAAPASGIALLLDGASRREAATASGMDRQTVCDWVHRYDAGGVAGLASRTGPGRPAGVEFIAQLWEIDENLARSELTPSQIAEHMAKRKAIWIGKKTAESGGTSPTLTGSSRRTAAAPACA